MSVYEPKSLIVANMTTNASREITQDQRIQNNYKQSHKRIIISWCKTLCFFFLSFQSFENSYTGPEGNVLLKIQGKTDRQTDRPTYI